jgi:hypothetical protein
MYVVLLSITCSAYAIRENGNQNMQDARISNIPAVVAPIYMIDTEPITRTPVLPVETRAQATERLIREIRSADERSGSIQVPSKFIFKDSK